jgi:hypothetical protein
MPGRIGVREPKTRKPARWQVFLYDWMITSLFVGIFYWRHSYEVIVSASIAGTSLGRAPRWMNPAPAHQATWQLSEMTLNRTIYNPEKAFNSKRQVSGALYKFLSSNKLSKG